MFAAIQAMVFEGRLRGIFMMLICHLHELQQVLLPRFEYSSLTLRCPRFGFRYVMLGRCMYAWIC